MRRLSGKRRRKEDDEEMADSLVRAPGPNALLLQSLYFVFSFFLFSFFLSFQERGDLQAAGVVPVGNCTVALADENLVNDV